MDDYVHKPTEFDINFLLDSNYMYLVFFKSSDFVSKTIQRYEKIWGIKDPFSHVGIAIHSKFLKGCKCVDPKTFIILESTMSGPLNDGVRDICNNIFFGVQLRNFNDILKTFSYQITIFKLNYEINKLTIKNTIKSVLGIKYDYDIFNLLTVHVPINFKQGKKMFCSQLVCEILKELGLLKKEINSKKISPNTLMKICQDNNLICKKITLKI
jgi:hypothetical protein